MAFRLDYVLRLLKPGHSAKDAKPAFESQRQVYDFCRSGYRKSGGPNGELRRLYASYVNSGSHDRRNQMGTDSRKKLPQELHLRSS